MIVPPSFTSLKKDGVIRELRDQRRRYFQEDPGARDRIEAEVRKQFEEKYPPFSGEDEHCDISTQPIFCLSKDVLQLARYKSSK